jgi:hypothetical protein
VNVTDSELAQVNGAVDAFKGPLSPEDRFDLRQELVIKLLRIEAPPNVFAWAAVAAKNWVFNLRRDREAQLEILRDAHRLGSFPSYRKGENWRPSWYPPHPDAREFAPFAMREARMMYVSKGGKR